MLVHRGVTPQQYVAGTHLYTSVKRDKVEHSSCLRKQRDGRGLNPGPPDPELEVLTTRPHSSPQKISKASELFSRNFYMQFNVLRK